MGGEIFLDFHKDYVCMLQAYLFSTALKEAEDFLRKEERAENRILWWTIWADFLPRHGAAMQKYRDIDSPWIWTKGKKFEEKIAGTFMKEQLILYGSSLTPQDILWLIKEDKRTEPQVQIAEELCHTF